MAVIAMEILTACLYFVFRLIHSHNLTVSAISSASDRLLVLVEELSSPTRSLDVPIGLQNPGKVCYANSVLQCLFHIGPFQKAMYVLTGVASSVAC